MISIIVPAYNAEKHIVRCIDSILGQDYEDIEVIVVNDGSKDNTQGLLQEHYSHSAKVKVFDIDNHGACYARKHGVHQAQGDYVMFVDADDTIPVRSVSVLYNLLAANQLDIAGGSYVVRYLDGKKIVYKQRQGIYNQEEYIQALLEGRAVSGPWAKLFKRDLLIDRAFEFPMKVIRGEDLLMNFRMLYRPVKVGITDECVYGYLINSASVTQTFKTTMDYEMAYLSLIAESIPENLKEKLAPGYFRFKLRVLYVLLSEHVAGFSPKHRFLKELREEAGKYKLTMQEKILLCAADYPVAFNFISSIRKSVMNVLCTMRR